MAYKQPYKQVNKSNDGASEPFTALVLGAAKLGKAIATGIKGLKAASATAKGLKATKLATKAENLTKLGKVDKAGKVLSKSKDVAAKASTKMGQASNWAERANKAGKFADKVKSGTTKAQQAVTSTTEKVKGSKIGSKVGDKVDKFKDGYDKVAGKIADKTGFDKQNIKDYGAEKGREILDKSQESIMNKLSQSGGEGLDPAERGISKGITPPEYQGSYENPSGANMFKHRSNHGPSIKYNYDNVGSSMKPIVVNNADGGKVVYRSKDGASKENSGLDEYDLKPSDVTQRFTTLENFQAPVTIKGVTFDAGDVLRLGMMGYRAGKKGIENRKANAPKRKEEKRIKKGKRGRKDNSKKINKQIRQFEENKRNNKYGL